MKWPYFLGLAFAVIILLALAEVNRQMVNWLLLLILVGMILRGKQVIALMQTAGAAVEGIGKR